MAKEKLLGDVPLPKGMGANMANAACKMWRDWKIPFKRLIALGFDTTGTMTGSQQGEAAMNRIIDSQRQAQKNVHIKDRFSPIFKRNAFPLLVAFEILSG